MSIFLAKLRTEESSPKELKVRTEMIDVQKDDYVVDEMERIAGEMLSIVKENKIKDPWTCSKNPAIYNLIKQYESAISTRFGFQVSIIPANTYCAYIVGPQNVVNNITSDVNYVKSMYKDYINDFESYSKEARQSTHDFNIDNPDIKDWQSDINRTGQLGMTATEYAIAKTSVNSINLLTEQLNSFGVIIDWKNAKIKNLPKDFKIVLCLNVINQDMTPREQVALTLHEVGHAFNNIAYGNKAVNNVSVLIDTFFENVIKRNKAPKESLLIAYKTAFKDNEADKLKDKNIVSAYIYVMSSSFKYTMNSLTPSEVHGHNDAEQLADQFSGRFGMGQELASGLAKIHKGFQDNIYKMSLWGTLTAFFMTVITIAIPPLIAITVPLMSIMFVSCLTALVGSFFNQGDYQWTSYDDELRRLQRIRNEVVRQLREFKSDPNMTKLLLSRIEQIDSITENTRDMLGRNVFKKFQDPITKLFDVVFRSRKSAIDIKRIEQIQEDLNSNELYVASAKLNQIKGV